MLVNAIMIIDCKSLTPDIFETIFHIKNVTLTPELNRYILGDIKMYSRRLI